MIKHFVSAAALTTALIGWGPTAIAKVQISIDLTTQRMHVTSTSGSYTWKVSTGRGKYHTPLGTYRPTVMRRMHYSRKYDNAPMPYSIFFRGGYAIHGTKAVRALGRPASHGCIRLSTRNAAKLYAMVKREGASIRITGSRAAFYANYRKNKARYAQTKRNRKLRRARNAPGLYMKPRKYTNRRYAIVRRHRPVQQPRANMPVERFAAPRGFIVVNSRHAPLFYAQQRNYNRSGAIYFHSPR